MRIRESEVASLFEHSSLFTWFGIVISYFPSFLVCYWSLALDRSCNFLDY